MQVKPIWNADKQAPTDKMNSNSPAATVRRFAIRGLLIAIVVGLLSLAAVLARLKLHEADLVFRTAMSQQRALEGADTHLGERIDIAIAGGQRLAGILLQAAPDHASGYWILHLHGNADSAFSNDQQRHIRVLGNLGFSVLAFDYRGFGLSRGEASETHLYEDAGAAYEYLLGRGVPPDRILLWGHSLGGGPATYLAAQRRAAALLLFGAFTSIPEIAQDTYPHLPVKWLAGIQLDSLARLPQVRMPVLIVHSAEDRVIPLHHAHALFAAANEPKQLLVLNDPADRLGGHADALYEQPELLAPALSRLLGLSVAKP